MRRPLVPSLRVAVSGAGLAWRLLRAGTPRRKTVSERLQEFPTDAFPLRHAVSIRWNDHQVPYIEAEDDLDLAVALGAVHAHLRLGQMEMMRRLAQGRLSEMVGPAALGYDHALRLLDVGRAVPAIRAQLPDETRVWLERFAEGINVYTDRARERPYDLAALGVEREPWTLDDLLRLSRLAATDFTWKIWLRLVKLRERADWAELWERLSRQGGTPIPSYAGSGGNLEWVLGALDRGGSNSVAVSAARSASGGALIASDPHLSLVLPNLWLIAGCRAPGFNVVGLMIPGIPAFALGRNRWIAWGGTSLHAASSDLVDVSDLPEGEIRTRCEQVKVRGGKDREIRLRETRFGPVISDAVALGVPSRRPFALRWMGHEASDELSALLAVNRARDWQEFRRALRGFAIPAQNMIYADAAGHVGQAIAAHLPSRPLARPADIVSPRESIAHWEDLVDSRNLPHRFDPEAGVVASANDPPAESEVIIGYFFAPKDRVERALSILRQKQRISHEDLFQLQRDVCMPGALVLRDRLLELLRRAGSGRPALVRALADWNGVYSADSRGAAAFEVMSYHLVRALHGREKLAVYEATWDAWALLREDIEHGDPEKLARAMSEAARRASAVVGKGAEWGDLHRLRLAHPFGVLPGTGRRFRLRDMRWSGSNETLMKAAYGFSGGRHRVRLGANARHVSDMADPDANWFLLLGGQDGWLGSTTFADQVRLWADRKTIRVPLRAETVRREFRHHVRLLAGETGRNA